MKTSKDLIGTFACIGASVLSLNGALGAHESFLGASPFWFGGIVYGLGAVLYLKDLFVIRMRTIEHG